MRTTLPATAVQLAGFATSRTEMQQNRRVEVLFFDGHGRFAQQ